jgi:mono/diheme cytochrome c family protein
MISARSSAVARFALCALWALSVGRPIGAQEPVDFGRQIRPILSDRCFACHGPDDRERKAELRFGRGRSSSRATRGRASSTAASRIRIATSACRPWIRSCPSARPRSS